MTMNKIELPKELEAEFAKHDFSYRISGDKIILEKINYSSPGQLSLFPLNARIGKRTPSWKALGYDQPITFLNH